MRRRSLLLLVPQDASRWRVVGVHTSFNVPRIVRLTVDSPVWLDTGSAASVMHHHRLDGTLGGCAIHANARL